MRVAVVAAVAVLMLGACGDDGNSTAAASGAPSVSTSASGGSAATTAPASTAVITIKDFAFKVAPASAGAISARNDDGTKHTVTADDGSFDVSLDGGSTASIPNVKAGTYSFHCKIHSSMKATLTVT